MSSGELEVRQESAPARVVPPKPKTDDWALVIGPVTQLAETVANTDFVPSALRGKPAAVAAAILFGRELDMPPMQALNQVHVIEGRPSLSAEHMRAMVLAAGHSLTVTGDAGQAVATGRRLLWRNPQTGEPLYGEPVTVTWTMAQAKYAGLVTEKRKNWLKYPRAMLKARATAELCRDMFADITHGLDAVEEAEDDDAVPGSAPAPTTEKVSRAKKRVASPSAPVAVADAETSTASGASEAPDSVDIPEVPLPGEEEPADHTPGEGLDNKSTSSPAGAALQCPHISNGEQCRFTVTHKGPHSFGGGLKDPIEARHCSRNNWHEPHAWPTEKPAYTCSGDLVAVYCDDGNRIHGPHDNCPGRDHMRCEQSVRGEIHEPHGWHDKKRSWWCTGQSWCGDESEHDWHESCPGTPGDDGVVEAEIVDVELPDSEGDGSAEDVAATGSDESYMASRFKEAQEAAGGPVPENDPPLSAGKRRLLLAAFNALGVTDRAERLHTSSALLGRQVETWNDLTSSDGDKLIRAVNGLQTRDELEKLVQRAAAEWGAQP